MKIVGIFVSILFSLLSAGYLVANTNEKDSLRIIYEREKNDTNRLNAYYEYIKAVEKDNIYLAFRMTDTLLEKSSKMNFHYGKAVAYASFAYYYQTYGIYDKSLDYDLKALSEYLAIADTIGLAITYNEIGLLYGDMKQYALSVDYFKRSLVINRKIKRTKGIAINSANLSDIYQEMGKLDSALHYAFSDLFLCESQGSRNKAYAYASISLLYLEMGKLDKAELYADSSLTLAKDLGVDELYSKNYLVFGNIYKMRNKYLQAIKFYETAEYHAKRINYKPRLAELYDNIAESFSKLARFDSAYYYQNKAYDIRDSIFAITTAESFAKIDAKHFLDRMEIERNELYRKNIFNENFRNILILAIVILTLGATILIRSQLKNKKLIRELKIKNDTINQNSEQIIYLNQVIKNSYEEISQQLTDNQELSNRLFALNETKDKLFSIIAHDIKNPLTGIYGLADLLENYGDDISINEVKSFASSIKTGAASLNNLLDNLLYWARVQTNKIEFSPTNIYINEIVTQTVAIFKNNAAQKEINIVCDIEEQKLSIDKYLIQAVIRNLISNALKFSYPKSSIAISSKIDEEYYRLSVSDRGKGLTPEKLSSLFDSAVNESEVGTNQEKGVGLGLSICKEFVEMHNGKIVVESIYGDGATFSIFLPLKTQS
jgi:signal transduction histidine kinase